MNASASVSPHKFVSQDEWLAARRDLLNEEKQLTKQQQRVAAARRELPWIKVTKEHVFDTLNGKVCLDDLFAGRSQLIIKHNMLNPKHDVCVGCSFEMDAIEGARVHLEHHDVSNRAVRGRGELLRQCVTAAVATLVCVASTREGRREER